MKQQADKLFDKQERQIQTYRYSLEGEYRAMHIGEGARFGSRGSARMAGLRLSSWKDGTPGRHIILEQGNKFREIDRQSLFHWHIAWRIKRIICQRWQDIITD